MAASKADILALAKAGFSAKQIATILNEKLDGDSPAPAPAPVPQPEPKPAPENKDENKGENKGESNNDNMIQMMNQKFDQMIQLMQAQNLANSQQPKQESVDDIIASIINPKGSE